MLQQILINPQSRFIGMLLVCVAAGRSGYLEAESRRPRWFILFAGGPPVRTTEPPGAGVSREECRCQRSVCGLARELERSFTEQ